MLRSQIYDAAENHTHFLTRYFIILWRFSTFLVLCCIACWPSPFYENREYSCSAGKPVFGLNIAKNEKQANAFVQLLMRFAKIETFTNLESDFYYVQCDHFVAYVF